VTKRHCPAASPPRIGQPGRQSVAFIDGRLNLWVLVIRPIIFSVVVAICILMAPTLHLFDSPTRSVREVPPPRQIRAASGPVPQKTPPAANESNPFTVLGEATARGQVAPSRRVKANGDEVANLRRLAPAEYGVDFLSAFNYETAKVVISRASASMADDAPNGQAIREPTADSPPGRHRDSLDDRPPPNSSGGIPRQTLERLKGATVFVRVGTGPLATTGSGFLLKKLNGVGYIVTSAHVVALPGRSPARIECVFHSGSTEELSVAATVAGLDQERDLAILKVRMNALPKAVDLSSKVAVVETLPVYIVGFPFGGSLRTSRRQPSVTISRGSISSIRKDDFEQIKVIQIDGDINPGNSGGPIVDSLGRLIGIAVAEIEGTQIGLAIPTAQLTEMLQGRPHRIAIEPAGRSSRAAHYQVQIDLIDPMRQIKRVTLYSIPKSQVREVQRPNGQEQWNLVSSRMRSHALVLRDGTASGTISLQVELERDVVYLVQAHYVAGDGKPHYCEPIELNARLAGPPSGDVAGSQPAQQHVRPDRPPKDEDEKSVDDRRANSAEKIQPKSKVSGRYPVRLWTDDTGHFTVEAAFGGSTPSNVILEKCDGQTVKVPLHRLSDEDREYLAELTRQLHSGRRSLDNSRNDGKTSKRDPAAASELNFRLGRHSVVPVPGCVYEVVWDGKRDLAYLSNRDLYRIQAVSLATRSVKTLMSLDHMPTGIAISPDGNSLLVTFAQFNQIQILDLNSLSLSNEVALPQLAEIDALCVDYLDDNEILVRDMTNRHPYGTLATMNFRQKRLTPLDAVDGLARYAISNNRKFILIMSYDGKVALWNTETRKTTCQSKLAQFGESNGNWITQGAVSNDGRTVLVTRAGEKTVVYGISSSFETIGVIRGMGWGTFGCWNNIALIIESTGNERGEPRVSVVDTVRAAIVETQLLNSAPLAHDLDFGNRAITFAESRMTLLVAQPEGLEVVEMDRFRP
jgi:S1-C subfamily serine protease/DNA-binding beta-propeller fold protein YncE